MKEYNFYRYGLLLPIIAPVFAYYLIFLGIDNTILFILLLSLIVGGIPYILLVFFLVWWSFKKNLNQFKHLLKITPIILGLFFLPFMLIIEQIDNPDPSYNSMFVIWLWIFIYIQLFGYVYLFIIFNLSKIGIKIGWIKNDIHKFSTKSSLSHRKQ